MLARWQETGDRLTRLGGQFISPASEIAIIEMNEAIRELEHKRAVAANPVNDERLRAARSAFETAVHRYHLMRNEVVESQRHIWRYHEDRVYRMLFDMHEALQQPPATQDLLDQKFGGATRSADIYHLRQPDFADAGSYGQALAWINNEIVALQARQATVTIVRQLASEQIDSRLHRIANALLKRVEALEYEANRNATLLQRLLTRTSSALSERIDQIAGQIERISKAARYVRKQKGLKHAKERSVTRLG
jgi:hypothetical protein